jgi:uridylate kinase
VALHLPERTLDEVGIHATRLNAQLLAAAPSRWYVRAPEESFRLLLMSL